MRLTCFLGLTITIWADSLSQNDLGYEDFKEMHLNFCKSFKNRENSFCTYDGEGLPDTDLPPGWQKLIELRYEQSMGLCNKFYEEFHNVTDQAKIHNSYIANGAQGLVLRCSTDEDGVEPAVVAQKIYFWTFDKNMTENELINTAVSEAGVRPPLYWFHDKGYFEEFLGHKTDLNKIPGQIYDPDVLVQTAKNLADMHKVDVPNINQAKYKEIDQSEWYEGGLVWNTREIKNFFSRLEPNYDMESYVKVMGWSYDEYLFNVEWTENLVRGYYKDEEEPVLCHNDVHGGNLMMDKNGTADSVILVDFDLASYGFPALDWACLVFYSSISYTKDYPDMNFIPDDVINSFLESYLIQSELENSLSLTEIRKRFDIHLIFVIFSSSFMYYGYVPMEDIKWSICELERLQIQFDHPHPIRCEGFPYDQKQCDECESILVNCILNCDDDATCISNCNRDNAECLNDCYLKAL